MVLVNTTTFIGSVASYTCEPDFWLDGDAERVCENSGFWSGSKPVCKSKKLLKFI